PVEVVDEGGDGVIVDRHGRSCRSGTSREELLGLSRRQLSEEVDVFGGVAQRCAAGGEYPQVGHSGQEVVDDGGDPVDEMFAVVEDEQIRSRAQRSDEAAAQIRAGGVAIYAVDSLSYVEAVGDRAQDLIGMADCGQLDDMDAGEVAEPSDLLSKARLSQPDRKSVV